jgi:dipeptidyl aminopeptidase/acylaminoacyl peptidase
MPINLSRSKILLLLLLSSNMLFAQQKPITPYNPSHSEIVESYKRSTTLDSALRRLALTTTVRPTWNTGGKSFWYRAALKNRDYEFYLANAEKGTKQKAFDHEKMAAALSKVTGSNQNALRLPIRDMEFGADDKQLKIRANNTWYDCDLQTYALTKTETPAGKPVGDMPARRGGGGGGGRGRGIDSLSPDKQWVASIKGYNLYIKSVSDNKQTQLTSDGSIDKPYGRFSWSPDSKHVVAFHIDEKKTREVYYILADVPGTTRGQLKSHPYAQPGDEVTTYQMSVFSVADKSQIKIDVDKTEQAPAIHWRVGDSRYFTYEKSDRDHQRFRIVEVDATNGKTKNIIDEKTNTFIFEQRIFIRYLPETHEIVWITDKDGWRHIYLVNEITGQEKLITKGDWVVRDIDSIDVKKRQIWFKGSGMNATEDPYFVHYYRIDFDGQKLFNLTPEIGNHTVAYSPGGTYYQDTYSQINVAPVIALKSTATGKKLVELEHPDTKELLATGVKLPEPFVAKGRDGKTDIWGVICRPSNMDPAKSYPIIENIYAGPQDSFVPKNFSPFSEMQSIAELGFIVVQIDGMGTDNRSKAFHDVCWKNIADAGFPDRILWMKAMAKKYPQADINRVGIYGTSAGGQNSTGGMLFHPEFYKAAVSACGCHDNRIDKLWWNEQWMGYPVGPHYDEQSNITNAYKLKGNLMLIVGEADTNVPPESTFRLADALKKADKDFDLLIIGGSDHTDGGPYGRAKKRDFFVKHLLNVDPPAHNSNELASAK